ncbi:hypothetical protein BST83_13090 [Polaribacter filamentus]|uniref:Uncharacterized protein n=1 Tax=Polaribacter filamentus TaxID=53483 RepID=A0A2S7KZ87_9FLAO|nr:hypothetical protein BST83_13090 [Polaribacter filamentus]
MEINYPYAVLDNLGNTTSNFPGLFYLGTPFYLRGDVGFLQPFDFLFFYYLLFFQKLKTMRKFF